MKLLVWIATAFWALSLNASAQPFNRSKPQGYVFSAPGVGNIGPGKANIQFGAGGEGFIYKGLGIGVELGGVGPLASNNGSFSDWVVGLGSANLSYHFLPETPNHRLEPFVTAGYSLFFRAGLSHGYNAGSGVNVWLNRSVAMRFEIRDHHSWRRDSLSFRLGLTFR